MLTQSDNQLVNAVRNGGYIVHHGESVFSVYCHAASSYMQQCSLADALHHMRQGLKRTTGYVGCWNATDDTWDSEFSLNID